MGKEWAKVLSLPNTSDTILGLFHPSQISTVNVVGERARVVQTGYSIRLLSTLIARYFVRYI